jgi:hypothetical protein
MFPKFGEGGRAVAQTIGLRQATCQQSMSRHFKRIENFPARNGVAFAAAARGVWCISNNAGISISGATANLQDAF